MTKYRFSRIFYLTLSSDPGQVAAILAISLSVAMVPTPCSVSPLPPAQKCEDLPLPQSSSSPRWVLCSWTLKNAIPKTLRICPLALNLPITLPNQVLWSCKHDSRGLVRVLAEVRNISLCFFLALTELSFSAFSSMPEYPHELLSSRGDMSSRHPNGTPVLRPSCTQVIMPLASVLSILRPAMWRASLLRTWVSVGSSKICGNLLISSLMPLSLVAVITLLFGNPISHIELFEYRVSRVSRAVCCPNVRTGCCVPGATCCGSTCCSPGVQCSDGVCSQQTTSSATPTTSIASCNLGMKRAPCPVETRVPTVSALVFDYAKLSKKPKPKYNDAQRAERERSLKEVCLGPSMYEI